MARRAALSVGTWSTLVGFLRLDEGSMIFEFPAAGAGDIKND